MNTAQLEPGFVVDDRYEILNVLGVGGCGVVYRARERTVFDRLVALKRIHPRLVAAGPAKGPDFVSMFAEEARLLTRVSHPGVMQLINWATDGQGVPYIVSELIDGRVMALPSVRPEMSPRQHLVAVMTYLEEIDQLLEVIGCCHREGVIHCDLKPENVMVQTTFGTGGLVRVLDFGIARVLSGEGFAPPSSDGSVRFTLAFAAPEQLRNEPLAPATDIYALGLMLSFGLTGREDHAANPEDPPMAQYVEIQKIRCRRRTLRPGAPVPPILADVIERALMRRPADRFTSAAELRAALRQAVNTLAHQEEMPQPFPPPSPPEAGDVRGILQEVGLADVLSPASVVHPESPPGARECLVVLPEGSPYREAYEGELRPLLEQLLGAGGPRPALLDAERLAPARIGPAEAEALEYARLVLWEVSGLPPKVDHLLQLHVTLGNAVPILLRGQELPLELLHIGALSYGGEPGTETPDIRPMAAAVAARVNRRWWPRAMMSQWASRDETTPLLLSSMQSVMRGDTARALRDTEALAHLAPDNPLFRYRHATLAMGNARGAGDWRRIVQVMAEVVREIPELAPGWKQLGVALDKLHHTAQALHCLDRATYLAPHDFDAWAALGGVLKRKAQRLEHEAQRCQADAERAYEAGTRISGGHPYPLLNLVRMRLINGVQVADDPTLRERLEAVVDLRSRQAVARFDEPWSHLDLAEALLFLGKVDDAAGALRVGARHEPYAPWVLESFIESLRALSRCEPPPRGLEKLLALTEQLVRREDAADSA